MKRTIALLVMLAALAIPALAQDSDEKVTALEGTLVMVQGSDGRTSTMLRLADGSLVAIELPQGDLERLQLRERDRLKVSGVFIGSTSESRTQARILARTMVKGGKALAVEDPIRLTERDRLQIRAYEEEQLEIQAQTQTQTKTQAKTQASSSGGSTGGTGTGKK